LNAQLLVDSIPALIHTARPDGYLDYFNKPWLEYLGVTLDEVAGWNWTAFVHPEDVEGIVAKWRACLATGEIFEYENPRSAGRMENTTGCFHRKVPLRDANGKIVKWYGSSLDIEERKNGKKKNCSAATPRSCNEASFILPKGSVLPHMGSWAWNVRTGTLFWSEEIFSHFTAYSPRENRSRLGSVL